MNSSILPISRPLPELSAIHSSSPLVPGATPDSTLLCLVKKSLGKNEEPEKSPIPSFLRGSIQDPAYYVGHDLAALFIHDCGSWAPASWFGRRRKCTPSHPTRRCCSNHLRQGTLGQGWAPRDPTKTRVRPVLQQLQLSRPWIATAVSQLEEFSK